MVIIFILTITIPLPVSVTIIITVYFLIAAGSIVTTFVDCADVPGYQAPVNGALLAAITLTKGAPVNKHSSQAGTTGNI
ncbi:response regulator containing a CheY-like receiver domain and an HD-GYP domain [Moorella thermoacetica Y72]|uniref:Response regulator containing a CheY-like receiver domain and an HD-GYP domain n=1 Tax=Moorella thermoacetica Y72 TaxID=1325331 RepID=A0A0S6UE45_NEOTH|nr:response regulator containing a CheY-like receiver domain and an HD-GYP domain [Moorella thermoacetica Y72]